MTNTTDTPDYRRWSRDDLITETTRQSLLAEEADKRGLTTRAQVRRENYHRAMAALLALTKPFDDAAALRVIETRQGHLQQAEAIRRERLGLEGGGV